MTNNITNKKVEDLSEKVDFLVEQLKNQEKRNKELTSKLKLNSPKDSPFDNMGTRGKVNVLNDNVISKIESGKIKVKDSKGKEEVVNLDVVVTNPGQPTVTNQRLRLTYVDGNKEIVSLKDFLSHEKKKCKIKRREGTQELTNILVNKGEDPIPMMTYKDDDNLYFIVEIDDDSIDSQYHNKEYKIHRSAFN
jgi:hypothetical protein